MAALDAFEYVWVVVAHDRDVVGASGDGRRAAYGGWSGHVRSDIRHVPSRKDYMTGRKRGGRRCVSGGF